MKSSQPSSKKPNTMTKPSLSSQLASCSGKFHTIRPLRRASPWTLMTAPERRKDAEKRYASRFPVAIARRMLKRMRECGIVSMRGSCGSWCWTSTGLRVGGKLAAFRRRGVFVAVPARRAVVLRSRRCALALTACMKFRLISWASSSQGVSVEGSEVAGVHAARETWPLK